VDSSTKPENNKVLETSTAAAKISVITITGISILALILTLIISHISLAKNSLLF
jgi:hypothetical protein